MQKLQHITSTFNAPEQALVPRGTPRYLQEASAIFSQYSKSFEVTRNPRLGDPNAAVLADLQVRLFSYLFDDQKQFRSIDADEGEKETPSTRRDLPCKCQESGRSKIQRNPPRPLKLKARERPP